VVIYFHISGYRVPDLNENDDRLNLNGNNWNELNDNRYSFGIALVPRQNMVKTYNKLYGSICSLENIRLAWSKARNGKTLKKYVIEFENELEKNILKLHLELRNQNYQPFPLKMFVIRDPKTRIIHKSNFRDRIVHHAIINIIEPIFDKIFIYDSYANRKGMGNLKAIQRFDKFLRKVSHNGLQNGWFINNQISGYCLKADIKQYFQTVDHKILLNCLKRKINDEKLIFLLEKIVANFGMQRERERVLSKGMPIGNLTSQFFANVYLNELDYFVKHKLKVKYYIRYVDDFVILHKSKEQLGIWKDSIDKFLKERLKIELHPQKSKIISLSKGVDFLGFRNFWNHRLLRKRNIRKMQKKIKSYEKGDLSFSSVFDSYQGWQAYARWANTYGLREEIKRMIIDELWDKI